MSLLKYNAAYNSANETFFCWKNVNDIIMKNMTPEIREQWSKGGYEGMAKDACKYFGIYRIYRDTNQSISFEFTVEQWVWFMLRWS